MNHALQKFVFIGALLLSHLGYAQSTEQLSTLITNAKIFDGESDGLKQDLDVLIVGDKIASIAANIAPTANTRVIDAAGRTLTPGFIGMHEHIIGQMPLRDFFFQDTRFAAYVATQTAETYLMNGFTTIRDVAGNTFSLKLAIDRDIVVGPRIYPSGPMISQTAGHSDHRHASDGTVFMGDHSWDPMIRNGDMMVVDGVPEVLKGVRENLRQGASQIKIAVGGGTGSVADPLEVIEFTEEEIRAAVSAAEDYGTYVLAHVYNNDGIRRAIDNGVMSVEHANLIDESTLRHMKDKGVWLSPQVITYTVIPNGYTEGQAEKHRKAYAGLAQLFSLAKKIDYQNIVFGSDIITDPATLASINREFVYRNEWFSPYEILRQATSSGGKLLALSGHKNPYPAPLGVIKEGAYADLLLINGSPLEDISILTNAADNLALIMKGGTIYKNQITQ